MRQVNIPLKDGTMDVVNTYEINEVDLSGLDHKAFKAQKKKGLLYNQEFATFDIETTTIDIGDKHEGFMYHWQMCIGGIVVVGRYWKEWLNLLDLIEKEFKCSENRKFIIYVHNLGYEMAFMYDFLIQKYGNLDIFASQKRKPINIKLPNGIEFRCSWKLSNMSLNKATINELGCNHIKAVGDLDYKMKRTPDTYLNDEEFGYCVADVVSLYDFIKARLHNEHDNLELIPMTSTGYVRRDCRKATKKDPEYRKEFVKMTMTKELYAMFLEAGRGGDTHANRFLSGRIWHNVDSYDAASSYPFQMLTKQFPMTKFTLYGEIESRKEFKDLIDTKACLFHVLFKGLEIKPNKAMPYIPLSKCIYHAPEIKLDNGRVLSSDYLYMCITDIDYRLIKAQYKWKEIAISDMYIATYGYLPEALREPIKKYFVQKSELKDKVKNSIGEQRANYDYLYMKSKNRLNGIFGMAYTKPVHEEISINEEGEWITTVPDIQEALDKYYNSRNNFLVYAWGVWVTCHAREHLAKLVDVTSQNLTIYCDTDSSKCIHDDSTNDKIDALNRLIREECDTMGAYADVNGTRYYLGVFEKENKKSIKKFKTLGAKKYVYEDENGLHVTIAGVNKEKGATELGCIENFSPNFIFKEAGGQELFYNDGEGVHEITVDGCTFQTGSNIGMVDSTYTIGITSEYAELIGWNAYEDINKD